MLDVYLPAVIAAFTITLVEMTEVVALVFALSSDHTTVRTGALGAVAGTTTVSLVALGLGALLIALPRGLLLWSSSVVLVAFGMFLYRSTLRAYRRAAAVRAGTTPPGVPTKTAHAAQFGGGFSVGAIEALETVIVLLALAAAGHGTSALIGALAGGILLVGLAAVLHERIRRIKVPWLKLGATALLFAFATFWAGEAYGYPWPGTDLALIPLFVVAVLIVRGSIRALVPVPPVDAKG
ncbi:MAG: hypothetical protein ACREDK_04915 [Thermoplasmata archaeon]